MRLLLVEDEPDLGAAVQQMLNHEAYVVDWFVDAHQAWERVQAEDVQYTLAVIDWMLPGMSGLDLCRRLRGSRMRDRVPSPHQSVPILMLTAKSEMFRQGGRSGCGRGRLPDQALWHAGIVGRLRALRRRSPQFHPPQLQVGPLTLDYGKHEVGYQDEQGRSRVVALTIKEFSTAGIFSCGTPSRL
jgi:DNA-binding response OmpR family regulator